PARLFASAPRPPPPPLRPRTSPHRSARPPPGAPPCAPATRRGNCSMTTLPLSAVGLVFGGSLVLSLVLVPLARALALRCGLVDCPDNRRKTHSRPIPVSGGLAIFTAASVVLLVAWLSPGALAEPLSHGSGRLLRLSLGAATICLVGVIDDVRPLRGRHKLLGQVVAALFVLPLESPVSAVHMFGVRLDLGWFAVPFALFF